MEERVKDRRNDSIYRVFEDAAAAREGFLYPFYSCFIEGDNDRIYRSRSQDSDVNASTAEARFLYSELNRYGRAYLKDDVIDLSYVAIGACSEYRISGTANFLARRSEYADISRIGYEFRIRISCRVPLLFTRARRRAITDSANVICRCVSASRIFISFFCSLYDVFGIDYIEDVAFNFCARYFGFFYYVFYVFIGSGIDGYSIYAFNDGLRDSDLAGATNDANCGNYFSIWWSRAGDCLVGFLFCTIHRARY